VYICIYIYIYPSLALAHGDAECRNHRQRRAQCHPPVFSHTGELRNGADGIALAHAVGLHLGDGDCVAVENRRR